MRHWIVRLSVASVFAAVCLAAVPLSGAQTAAAVQRSARVVGAVDTGRSVRLSGHVPAFADTDRLPSTAMAPSARLEHLTVVLSRAPEVEAAFEKLLADQVDPASPRFHQWLTPAQVGTLYGPAQADVDAVTGWLQSRGLTVDSVSPNRLLVDFSGPAASIESAFGTSVRVFSLANGEQRYSLTQDPTVPAALQPVVATVAGLSEVIHYSTARRGALVAQKTGAAGQVPALTSSSGNHYLVSGDFAVAYDINPAYTAGINGTGQKIAVVGESRVNTSDISLLEGLEGLPVKQANVIIPPTGTDPGTPGDTSGTDSGVQDEATLDVDRTIGTAPGATVDLIVSGNVGTGNTYATDGLFIAINYAISTVNDPILTISFGGCEYLNGQANDIYEQSLFQTAASQGITTFVSSGDSGAAACNAFYSTIPASQVLSINDFCASQYVTCLGGTEFADSTNPSAYWTTNGTNYVSLLSYIPEGAWNDVNVSTSGVYSQGATGGGTSIYLAKPSWQTGTGVPAGTFRWVPDISLASSPHDGFVTCLTYLKATCGSFYSFGGTSAAAPSMAGIQALVNQKLGGRQGNINPAVYALGGSLSSAFHDVTTASSGVTSCSISTPSLCNNSTPSSSALSTGLAGYLVTTGWDASTGWGSLDVAKYLTALSTASFTVSPAATALNVLPTAGTSTTDTISLLSIGGFAGPVTLTCKVTSTGGATGTCSIPSTPVTLTSGTSGTAVLTVTNTGTATGTLSVVVTATSGATTLTAPTITVSVANSSFTVTPASSLVTFTSGATSGNGTTLAITSVSGFTGTVALSCAITASSAAFPPSCAVSPTSVTLSPGTTTTAALVIGSTAAVTAGLDRHAAPFGWRLGGGGTLALLLFCMPLRKRRRGWVTLAALGGLMAIGLGAVTGCGSSGGTTTLARRSSAGSYTVTVSAVSGTTVTTSIAVTIQ